ncbi:MAG: hypothetical protein C0594_08090 [Marinilabiliales bacterium]|nr:MAG: hypothetical protein C0594_08090 [Marinilabiliales bacterium]
MELHTRKVKLHSAKIYNILKEVKANREENTEEIDELMRFTVHCMRTELVFLLRDPEVYDFLYGKGY